MAQTPLKRRTVIAAALGFSFAGNARSASDGQEFLPSGVTPTPPAERRVGVNYAMWHHDTHWTQDNAKTVPWGTPLLGFYKSDDSAVIRQHAEWIYDANIDFINIDWSNEAGVDPTRNEGPIIKQELEEATLKLFDVYSTLEKRPKISIMAGDHQAFILGGSFDALQAKADQIYTQFVVNPRYRPLVETYLGKPLLIVFLGVRISPIPPVWNDDRFTVRFMSAYIREHGPAFYNGPVSTSHYWSWEERGDPTFTIYGGHPEAMTVVASWRGSSKMVSPGRDSGRTFLANWSDARKIGPRYVLAGTFNEWWVAEQKSPDISKDIEPSKEFGFLYLDIVKQQAELFKMGA